MKIKNKFFLKAISSLAALTSGLANANLICECDVYEYNENESCHLQTEFLGTGIIEIFDEEFTACASYDKHIGHLVGEIDGVEIDAQTPGYLSACTETSESNEEAELTEVTLCED